MITVTPSGQACGAVVTDIDLTVPLAAETVKAVRRAWLDHHVLVFPDQRLSDQDFERFVGYTGPIGDDPFIAPIEGKTHIAAIRRDADETGKPFAETWHTDWSFMQTPPAATCLYGITIPATGGDTLFVNQHKAFAEMPANLRQKLDGHIGLHSARWAYADDGYYAADKYDGTMAIKTSNAAKSVYGHPLIRPHPETGRLGIFAGSYVLGLQSVPDEKTGEILADLNDWIDRPEFQYRHKWQQDMLIMWDNRSVLHKATGGYEGHDRLLHRLTIADAPAFYL